MSAIRAKKKIIRVRFPRLYRKQEKLLFHPARYVWIEGSTKSGKTHGCISWLLQRAFKTKPGDASWWVAPVYAQAKIAFRRAIKCLPKVLCKINKTELTIELQNAGTIFFKSAEKPDNLFGEDVHNVVVDEASRCSAASWEAVRSTLTKTRGLARIIGNVRGRKNWHYLGCRRAESGLDGHAYGKLTCWDAVDGGIFPIEEIEDARATMPEAVFQELFECNPADDAANPFGYDRIRACIVGLSPLAPVVYGIDLGKAVDFTVIVGLDAHGSVCRFHRFKLPWGVTHKKIVEIIRGVPVFMDQSGVGDPVIERLQNALRKERAEVTGFVFTSSSKQGLIEGLAIAIGSEEIRYPDGVIVQELEDFGYFYTKTGVRYEAIHGHDDAVCALALAWRAYEQTILYRPDPSPVRVVTGGRAPKRMRH